MCLKESPRFSGPAFKDHTDVIVNENNARYYTVHSL